MAGVINETICPVCGETYWYEFDTRTGEEHKLTSCACDREFDYLMEFIRMKGLEKEFQEFRKRKEKDYWYDWIAEKLSDDLEELLEKFEKRLDRITSCMNVNEVLEAVAEGMKDSGYSPRELEKLISKLVELLNTSEGEVRRKILAGIV